MKQIEQEQEVVTLELSEPQTMVFTSRKALNLDMAGQRAGKSQMIGILSGWFVTNYPRMKGFIGANTYLQLTQSTLIKATEIWGKYFQLTQYDRKNNPDGDFVMDKRPPSHFTIFEQFKDYNNIISFRNGAIIYIGSLDNWKAHDGKEFCWAHLDETKDTKEEAVTTVILARLSQGGLYVNDATDEIIYLPNAKKEETKYLRAYNPAYIHTSPAVGQVDWLIKMFALDKFEEEIRKSITDPDDFFYKEFEQKSVCIFSTYHNAENLPANYIEGRKAVLSENEQMKFIFGYPFSKTGGEYFPHFERIKHLKEVLIKYEGIRHITFDFNVLPYMTLLCAQVSFKMRYMDAQGNKHDEDCEGRLPIEVIIVEFYREYCLKNPHNTSEACCAHFLEYEAGNPTLEVMLYGDASGNSRIEGMGETTNYKIIISYFESKGITVHKKVRGFNIGVLTRQKFINRILEGKYPHIEVYFDIEMENTIRDFEFLKQGADGKLKELVKDPSTKATYQKLGHTSDAAEYLLCELLKDYINENN